MKILLHVCCGICAAGAAKTLIDEGHEVIGYFYNPNIQPEDEYNRRLEAVQKISKELDFHLILAPYKPQDWLDKTKLFANEPEGGNRCPLCFRIRLETTYQFLKDCGAAAFTTTLTIGPQKSAAIINKIGYEIGGNKFLQRDFKKKEGFTKAMQLAKQWQLYRQNYCGCIYSIRDKK